MRKLRVVFLIVLLGIILSNCAMMQKGYIDPFEDFIWSNPYTQQEQLKRNIWKEYIYLQWVYDNANYEKEDTDYWQSAKETENRGKGDCEDFAIITIGMIYCEENIKCRLLLVDTSDEGKLNHAVVEYKDKILDPTAPHSYDKSEYPHKIIEKIDYDAIGFRMWDENFESFYSIIK